MDLYNVMTEIGQAVDTITGLRVKAWAAENVTVPAALVTLPEGIDYHGTYAAGLQRITGMTVVALVGRGSDRIALKRVCEYAHPTGSRSVRKAIETYPTYTALDNVTVTGVTFDGAAVYADTEYLAAIFALDINGPAT